ncbi:sigma-70 family RNA polymerase sigma factor [Acidiferrimicrobium sp. IK]|uniref:RNA polymerase sigma factor n=1 Tax=Acidiferrimicrobium sp. IK TaxID=2871700 RepID=UPI0021CAFBDE|nr:sigma-70 family RNA polymerase sigma factor [Acidiferrimicrobium sp. IK]MCU4186833.1 sigma-70 family RNA polymerase sigma factor [Acidiferrimicrobium sp. IK]
MIGDPFESVLAAAQSGAEWAFAVLYRELNHRLLRYFAAQAPAEAEDLASETWLLAARQLRGFAGDETSFRAWLFTIARRRLVQHWRDCGRRPARGAGADGLDALPGRADVEQSVVDADAAHGTVRLLCEVLSPDQADVVLLRVLGGLDVEQVAAILHKRPGTVRVLQHKALRRLAEKFPDGALTL